MYFPTNSASLAHAEALRMGYYMIFIIYELIFICIEKKVEGVLWSKCRVAQNNSLLF